MPDTEDAQDVMLDTDDRLIKIEARVERIEALLVLLCHEASAGKGQLGAPFQRFVDEWRAEHAAEHRQR